MTAAPHVSYDTSGPSVTREELEAFASGLLQAVGMDLEDADFTARTLVHADLRGVHSHGVRMLPLYVRTLSSGSMNPRPKVREITSGPGHATFDGDSGLGQVAAGMAMERAIELARAYGVGTTVVGNTGHFGAAGYWVIMAAEAGCVGYCASNLRGPVLLATGGRGGAAGNNPLAWAFPGDRHRHTVLDMATGAVALGKIAALGEGGLQAPDGVAADAEGRPTRDPAKVAFVMPAAGAKGYSLAVLHDVLVGALTGGGAALQKPPLVLGGPMDGGLFFMAIDISAVMPLLDFTAAMDAQTDAVNDLQPAEGVDRVSMPGQIEWDLYDERVVSGIPFPAGVLDPVTEVAAQYGVAAPWPSDKLRGS